MATKNFRVRNGLEVGSASGTTNAVTMDGATGDIVTDGSVTFNGSTSGTVEIASPAVAGTQSYTLPTAVPAVNGYVLASTTAGVMSWAATAPGAGDVVGPASATDNALTRFDGTTGKLIQNSTAILSDTGNLSITGDLTVAGGDITTGTTAYPIKTTRTTASTSGIRAGLQLRVDSLNVPVVGLGTSLEFETETADTVFKTGGYIANSSTDVTSSAEDFKFSFHLLSNGSILERMSLDHLGNLQIDGDLAVDGGTVTLAGSTSGTVALNAPAIAGTQSYTLPTAVPAVNGYVLASTTGGAMSWIAPATGTGDVVGPASATDNAIARYDGTTGKLIQNSLVTIDDNGGIITPAVTGYIQTSTIYSGPMPGTQVANFLGINASLYGEVLIGANPGNLGGTGPRDLQVAGNITGWNSATGILNNTVNVKSIQSLSVAGVQNVLSLKVENYDTPVVNDGIGLEFSFDTNGGSPTYIPAGNIEVQSTDLTAGLQDFKMNFKLTSAGVSQTRMELNDVGDLQIDGDLTVSGGSISGVVGNDLVIENAATIVVKNDFTQFQTDAGVVKANFNNSGSKFTFNGNDVDNTGNYNLYSHGTLGTLGNAVVGGTLDVQGGTVTDSTGALQITTASNGNLTLAPNGTGDIVLTLANGGNLTNNRNYVFGAIRNATTESNGDIWVVDADSGGAGTLPVRGISIDNSSDTAKTAGVVVRNYSNTAAFSPRVVFERARGTSASPTTLSSGDTIGIIQGTGYSSTLGWINDTLPLVPAFASFTTAEAWASNTNLGTQFNLNLAPTATTLTTAGNLVSVIAANPQSFTSRSNSFIFNKGTGTGTNGPTLTINAGASNNIPILQVGDVNIIQAASTWQSALSPGFKYTGLMSSSTQTATGSYFEMSSRWKAASTDTAFVPPLSGWGLGRFGFSADNSTTGTSQQNCGAIQSIATENWDSTHYGSKLVFSAHKLGTGGSINVLDMAPETTIISSDLLTFKDSAGTNLIGSKITYNRVYGQFQYNTTVTPAAANTAYVFPLGTQDFANIVTVGSTSRLIPGAAGMYNIQFSVQAENADNAADHTVYIWLRKNGTDVAGSMGRFTVIKNTSGSLKIAGWNYLVDPGNTTDYFEIAYAVSDTNVTFPAFASTAFGPSTACIITTITPVGA